MKKLAFITIAILVIYTISFAQNKPQGFSMLGADTESIEINQIITSDIELSPFGNTNAPIYSAAVNAEIKFNGSDNVVRFILLDNEFNEYLVYESFPLVEQNVEISLNDICEETCILGGIKPYRLHIEVDGAEVNLKSFSYAKGMRQGFNIQQARQENKELQLQHKVKQINANLRASGKKWFAGATEVATKSYAERKKLFGNSHFPAGIEYYAGGIYTVDESPSLKSAAASSAYIPDWDWRNRHGKNWITSIKNQGNCGSCWAFAATGATEAMANLYFNDENLDLNLSEQDVLSCTSIWDDCDGGLPSRALDKIKNEGVVDETAFLYAASDLSCSAKSTSPSEIIRINGRINYNSTNYPATVEGLQKMIIELGPVSGGIYDWSHAMVLVGYHTVKEGDTFKYSDGNTVYDLHTITINAGDPLIGTVLWIFKNSWGNWGDGGYSYFDVDPSNIGWTHGVTTPIYSDLVTREVNVVDEDGDGFYWWGLGEKPAGSPGPDLADGDDSDPTLGPLDEYGYCTELAATAYNVYYGHLHNHTSISDGAGTPEDAYSYAKNTAGLDFFGLSDHAYLIDASEWTTTKTVADSYNQDGVFTTFVGFEWSHSTLGHVTIVNTDDYCTKTSVPTFPGLISWVNSRECAAFFNHPGRQNSTGGEFGQFLDTPSENFVGMELWNKNDLFDDYYYNDGYYSNDGELGYFDEALTRGWKIGAGGSEDNHVATWGTYNDCDLAVLASNLTRTDIYEAIKNRRFYSTLDKNIKMSFKIDGAEMGSTIEGAPGQALLISVSDDDGEVFNKVELYQNGILLTSWTPGVSVVDINENMTTSDGDYYYIKITQSDGDEAISSPIFIEGGITNILPVCELTNPDNNTHYSVTQTVVLAADASDSDGSIAKVEFYVNDALVGTDYSSPFEMNWTIPDIGSYTITAKATDNPGSVTKSDPVYITVGTYSETLDVQISSANDDVEEAEDGYIYQGSTDLELVYDTYASHNSIAQGNQVIGLRFSGLNIPQGATITSAYVQFSCDETTNNAGTMLVYGHNSDDSPAFTSETGNVSTRSKTSASVTWTPPAWGTVGAAGTDQQTPDLTSVIQEIVNRTGFTPASALTIIIEGTGTRIAEAYEGDATKAAILNCEYTVGVENQPPLFVVNPLVLDDGTQDVAYQSSIAEYATDPEDDPLTFYKTDGPDWLNISIDGILTGTPLYNNTGLNTWTIQVMDDFGNYVSGEIRINVINLNDPPEFTSNPVNLNQASEDIIYSADLSAYTLDKDNDDLTYTLMTGPAWLTVNENTGIVSGTPLQNDIGTNSWTVRISDQLTFTEATMNITVVNTNDAPEFVAADLYKSDALEDDEYSATLSGDASDEDNDVLQYSKVSGPSWLVVAANGSLSGMPVQADVGANSWTIKVIDNNGGNDEAILHINVLNVNDAPVFSEEPITYISAYVNQPYNQSIAGEASDEDSDALTFSRIDGPDWLTVQTDGTISGTPQPADLGQNSWTIQVNDGNGGTAQTTLFIAVIDPFNLEYCKVTGNISNEWIANIFVDGVSLIQKTPENGYSDYTGETPFDLTTNTLVSLQLVPGFSGKSSFQYWGVWIDYDKSGTFGSEECVLLSAKSKITVYGSFTTTADAGITRMRVIMSDFGTSSPCASVAGGEIEDYLVNIQPTGVNPPIADFTADYTSILEGETIYFTDLSLNNPTAWDWDFGNGQTSTLQNPSVTYNTASIFTVTLTASNSAGADVETKVNYITVEAVPEEPPIADFSVSATTVYVGDAIQFTDQSTNNPTTWLWNFGDVSTSTVQNPSHSYSAAGTFTVTLTAGNTYGSDQITKTDYITVSEAPVGDYCEPAIDNSSDYIVSVIINGQENVSNRNSFGYILFTSPVFDLTEGSSCPVTLTPFNDKNRNFWRIWFDANGDGDFIDAGETLLTANNKKGAFSENIIIPTTSVSSTRLRVAMKTGSSPAPCDEFIGEMEDYLVNILPAAKSASIQNNILLSNKLLEPSVAVYPNPFTDQIHIVMNGENQSEKAMVQIFDLTGRMIFRETYLQQTQIIVDDLQLRPGAYLIRVETNEFIKTERLVKTQ